MTYTHLTTDELVMIEAYYHQNTPVTRIAERLSRSRQPIYNVINFLKSGHTALDFYTQYKKNKNRCGRRKMVLPKKQVAYIQDKVVQGWTPVVIVGRAEAVIDCSARTLYRMFKNQVFDAATLPMKRKSNGQQDRRGKQESRRSNGIFPKGKPIILLSNKSSGTSKATPLWAPATKVQ